MRQTGSGAPEGKAGKPTHLTHKISPKKQEL
jgi:hypothetical protein